MHPLNDPLFADALVVKVVGSVTAIILACLALWVRFYRARTTVALKDGERITFEDAIKASADARREAHAANNAVMVVQRQLGRLEAENEACNKRADRQDIEIRELKAQNEKQAGQIDLLMRKKTFNPTRSDL